MEWEGFARSIWPQSRGMPDPSELRNDAEEILRTAAADMQAAQTSEQQEQKSRGISRGGLESNHVDGAARVHGRGRVSSGLNLEQLVAEYRALRATVLRLWRQSKPSAHDEDLDDVTRFNESMDQSLAVSVRAFEEQVERDRHDMLAKEQSARSEAETANRAKDIFLATLSHEMRTPLNAIAGWVDILRRQECSPEDLAEGLEVIQRNTLAQTKLIEDVLDVSRIVSGQLRLEVGACDLCDVINAGIDSVRPAAEARQIMLDVDLDPSASRVACDGTRIQQVVWNLLSNAVKFTPKHGRIGVTLAREQSNLRLDVSDNGQGISPDMLPHVFDRFRQAESGTRRHFGGLGLGLSIVRHLVEAHGGTVEAQSEGEGRGSRFIVRLPIQAVQSEEGADAGPGSQGARREAVNAVAGQPAALQHALTRLDGLRLLVVDDEADARRLLGRVLERAGATITLAGSAAEALQALSEHNFDVLLSDLGMPEKDGFDLLREARRRGHDATALPAVALTAFAHTEDQRQALKAGFAVHVAKPVDARGLTAVIARVSGRAAAE